MYQLLAWWDDNTQMEMEFENLSLLREYLKHLSGVDAPAGYRIIAQDGSTLEEG